MFKKNLEKCLTNFISTKCNDLTDQHQLNSLQKYAKKISPKKPTFLVLDLRTKRISQSA